MGDTAHSQVDAIKAGELPVTPVAEIPDPSKDVDADKSLTQASVQEGPVTEVEKIKLPNTSEDIDADKSAPMPAMAKEDDESDQGADAQQEDDAMVAMAEEDDDSD